MNDVITVRGRKYVRLTLFDYATVKPEILLEDAGFVNKVKRAYHGQVVCNGGWGFTVKHNGYRIRFDLPNSTGLPRIYEGFVLEKPETIQTKLEVSA